MAAEWGLDEEALAVLRDYSAGAIRRGVAAQRLHIAEVRVSVWCKRAGLPLPYGRLEEPHRCAHCGRVRQNGRYVLCWTCYAAQKAAPAAARKQARHGA